METVFLCIGCTSLFLVGLALGATWIYARQPPKIKRLMNEYEDDCKPRMLVGIDPAEHRADFERRWEIVPKKKRHKRCRCEQCA